MPTDLSDQLNALGEELRRQSVPVAVDEIVAATDEFDRSGSTLRRTASPTQRTTRMRVAALVAAAAAIVGLAVVANRLDRDPAADQPAISMLPETMAAPGSFVLEAGSSEWALRSASDDRRSVNPGVFVRRIYVSESPRPEDGPALVIDSLDVDAGMPVLDGSTGTIDIGGAEGWLTNRPAGGRGLTFERGGYWYDLTGYDLTADDMVAAARAARRADDGYGAVVDPSGLPPGVVDEAVGEPGESWFLSRAALAQPIPTSRWENGTRSIWLHSLQQDPALDRFQRIGTDTVVETSVNGQPAFLRTLPDQGRFRSLTWHADGRTQMLGAVDVSADELVALAEALRPATSNEWEAALASVARDEACVGDGCDGQIQSGAIVPAGVDRFPIIDDALAPDDGRGTTFAQYVFYGEGLGPTWSGVIGGPTSGSSERVISVRVSAAEDAEPLPAEPGRAPGIAEYDDGSGVELIRTNAADITVIVQGRDIDELYEVIEHIEPTITDGALNGYTLTGNLPNGLIELERPHKRALSEGSFPLLRVNGGTLNIQVAPEPALTHIAGWIGPIERLDVNGQPAFFHALDSTDYAVLAVQLDDGTTLSLAGEGLSREDLLELARQIELVDEQTWKSHYDPFPAVIPTMIDENSRPPQAPATEE